MSAIKITPGVRRILIIGAQKTGKSTLARMIAKQMPIKTQLVVEPDSMGDGWAPFGYKFIAPGLDAINETGLKRTFLNRKDKDFLQQIKEYSFNQVLIFDDMKLIFSNMKHYSEMEELLGRARQYGNYIIFTIHSIGSVPPNFWSFFSDVILYKTLDKPDRSMYKIPDWERFEKAIEAVTANPNMRAFVYLKRSL